MPDWIPSDEPSHDRLLVTYSAYVAAHPPELKVSQEAGAAFAAKIHDYRIAQDARDAHERVGAPISQALRDATEALHAEWRTLNAEITSQRTFTDVLRAGLGLPAPGASPAPAGAPDSKPVIVKIEADQRLAHIIHWVDENTPGSKAKPPGVKRTILFCKIGGPAPAGPSELEEIASDSATPYLWHFAEADAGKPAHWVLAWENSAGERGPLSAVSTWTIPG